MSSPPQDVPTLPAAASAGTAAEFEAIFRANYAPTVRLAHLLTGSNAIAEELAQDAFAQLLPRLGTLREPHAYLRVTTVNICRNWHRSHTREADRLRRHGVDEHDPGGRDHELGDLITALPYRQRAVLVLRYWLDLREAEIAAALHCRPGTVKSLHSRALATIRKELP